MIKRDQDNGSRTIPVIGAAPTADELWEKIADAVHAGDQVMAEIHFRAWLHASQTLVDRA